MWITYFTQICSIAPHKKKNLAASQRSSGQVTKVVRKAANVKGPSSWKKGHRAAKLENGGSPVGIGCDIWKTHGNPN